MDAQIIDGLDTRRAAKAARQPPVDPRTLAMLYPPVYFMHLTAAYFLACSEAFGNQSAPSPSAEIMHHARFRASRAPFEPVATKPS
jgi:hypothetical protein